MRIGVIGVVMLSVAGAASAASFSDFKRLCLDTNGRQETALAAADATGGWTVIDPTKQTLPPGVNLKLDSMQGRMRTVDGHPVILMVGSGQAPIGGANRTMEMCMMIAPVVAADVDATRGWAKVEPFMDMNAPQNGVRTKMTMFMFTDGPDGRKMVDTSKGSQMPGEPMTMLMLMDMGAQGGMLGHILIKP